MRPPDMSLPALPSPTRIAAIGLIGLAAAMGIGRFAFTPMLPLMQADAGLSIADGGWLAAANYLGYLLGGLACLAFAPRASRAARAGLVAVALSTWPMAFTDTFALWWALRLAAGFASAWVLVGVTGWALPLLARHDRPGAAGWVFAGVGAGIVVAGLVGLVVGQAGYRSAQGWSALGALAAAAVAVAWRSFGRDAAGESAASPASAPSPTSAASPASAPSPASAESPASAPSAPSARFSAGQWRLILCYGAFGFGYIIPATFLPALARRAIADPAVFGWVWPVFGLAAALSTIASARWFGRRPPRQVWAGAQVTMTAGVLLPVLSTSLAALVASAILIGGTFMVATMTGLQEARRVAAPHATRLVAAMTSAFAFGQLAGPLAVSAGARFADPIVVPSVAAAVLLLASSWTLSARDAQPAATQG